MVKAKPLPYLHRGDHIAVVSPAGKVNKNQLSKGIRAIEEHGYHVECGEYVYTSHRGFAGTDESRLHDLLWAFRSPEIRAVFCSRGGYGSSRLLSTLVKRGLGNISKLVVGFSDITALQWALWTKWRLPSLSGLLVSELGGSITPESEAYFWKVVQGKSAPKLGFGTPSVKILRYGEVDGILMPGCLSIICSLIGTPFLPDLKDAILVIEDVGEVPYRIDRMLVQLKNAGVFDRISALVIGELLDSKAQSEIMTHDELHQRLTEILKDFKGPIITGIPYGHGKNRWTLPIGIPVKLTTNPFAIMTTEREKARPSTKKFI
jgi:muramoyltetrapeptide carboxypeptidase